MAKYFEVTGNINKEETVQALEAYKIKNTFVLRTNKPFPGYYHSIDEHFTEDKSTIFLITKNRESWESIIRATDSLNKFLDEPINASYASLNLFNITHYAIRIMGLKNLDELETIQKAYQEKGFVFMKDVRMTEPKNIFFQVKRFFNIKEIVEGIYKDDDKNFYIEINKKIEWELFRKMTQNVKIALNNSNFDVVSGAFYMNNTLVDIIRVYEPDCDIETLKEIKKEYHKQISKYF